MMRYVFHQKRSPGFTLIELMVVFSIIAIISTVTLASFSNYNKSSSLKQSGSQLASLLSDAKSRSLSQVKPASPTCNGNLDGYQVTACLDTTSPCSAIDTYLLSVVCSGTAKVLSTKKLPSAIHFSASGTTSKNYLFKILTGGVIGSGTITLTGYGITSIVTVSPIGEINVQ